MSKNRFILNDGTKVNSYGFRVRNSGINMARFNGNPVMLDEHWNNNRSVLGKWISLENTDTVLSAEPEFDEGDENAVLIKGKVERGYIKGCSIGLLYDPRDMEMQADGVIELTRCELMEASICAIPSNANAIRLYHKDTQELMSEEQVQLSLSNFNSNSAQNLNIDKMKRILLAQASLVALSLLDRNTNEGVDASLVDQAIAKLKTDLDTANNTVISQKTALDAANAALKTMQDAEKAAAKVNAEKEIQLAIDQGQIDATAKESWVKLMLDNPAMARTTLSGIPVKKSLGAQVHNPNPNTPNVTTADDFQKLSLEAQLEFKENNPEAYQKLFA